MKFSTGLLLAAASVASAQVSYDNSTDTWKCPVQNGSYCAAGSLSSSTIILCTNGIGYPGNCDGHAESRPPIDVYTAPCYESSPTAGNASCSKNCTVFPDSGLPFAVPGSCDYVSASPGSDMAGFDYGLNGTNSTGTYPNGTATNGSSSQSTPSGPTGTGAPKASSTSNSAPMAFSASTSSSIFGAALLAVVAFAL